MFMLYAIPLGLVLGVLLGGRLGGLAGIQFRFMPVIVGGLLVQVALFSPAVVERIGDVGPWVYVLSTGVVLLALVANSRISGVLVIAAGAFANMAAIMANGGYMPAGASALGALGRVLGSDYSNSAALAHPNLELFTDIFAMPPGMPLANIFSIGDVLIGVGVVIVIVAAMRGASRQLTRVDAPA